MKYFLLITLFIFSFTSSASSLKDLVHSIRNSKKTKDRVNAVVALRTRAVSLQEHDRVIHAGGLEAFIEQIKDQQSPKVLLSAFSSLTTLAIFSSSTRKKIYEQDVFPAALSCLYKYSRNKQVQIAIINFLSFFTKDSDEIRFDISSRFLPILKSFCVLPKNSFQLNSDFINRLEKTLKLIYLLSDKNDVMQKILREDNFSNLTEKIKKAHPSQESALFASKIFSNIYVPEPIVEIKKSKRCSIL